MKYIKLYEDVIKPKIGDFVYCSGKGKSNEDYIETNIGEIMDVYFPTPSMARYANEFQGKPYKYSNMNETTVYKIKYNPGHFYFEDWFERNEILDFSNNKEDLEYHIQAKKYNL